MKRTAKILAILLLVITIIFSFTIISNAVTDSESIVTTITEGGSNTNTSGIQNVGANIVSIITTIGIIVAVVVLLILGIKYMMGSASEKAEYKKTMIPYLVGAVLIFGASAIAKAVIAMSESITST